MMHAGSVALLWRQKRQGKVTAKFQKKVMKGFRENCEKPPFLDIFLARMGETGFFFKKSLWNIFFAVKSPN